MDSRQRRNLLSRRQKCGQQRRGKRSPGMIRSLVLLANRVGRTAEFPNHASRHSHCGAIPLNRKRHSRQRRPRAPHKRHQRMHRRYGRAPLRKPASSSLLNAPLECRATLPFHSTPPSSDRAARAISASGTQNQINSARTPDRSIDARTPYLLGQSPLAFLQRRSRESAQSLPRSYIPPALAANPSAVPRFPAPTIATRGFAAMPRSIAEGSHTSDFGHRRSCTTLPKARGLKLNCQPERSEGPM